jgi:integrase
MTTAGDHDSIWHKPNQEILDYYVAIAPVSERTAQGVADRVRAALAREAAASGAEPPLLPVITTPRLLGRVMRNDQSLRTGRQLNYRTMRLVRHAFRSLIATLPAPPGYTREDLRAVFEEARCEGERIIGLRRRLAVGSRQSRKSYVPNQGEIATIGAWLCERGAAGIVYAQLIQFLYGTGLRVGAALDLRARDLRVAPDSSPWVHCHEKARDARRPVLVPPEQRALVTLWRQLPADTHLWTVNGRPVERKNLLYWIERACSAVGVRRFTPHALRAAFARDLLPHLGVRGVMRAGGWRSAKTVTEHYLGGSNGTEV